MDLSKLKTPLRVEYLEFRVKSLFKWWYCKLLVYKDARVDMKRLDEVVWAMNWKREHTRDNHNCIVSIYDKDKWEWISKEDVGTPSNAEAEKWLASDSFKRACVNWGIGRELYAFPELFFKLEPEEYKVSWDKINATNQFKLKKWRWAIEHDDTWNVVALAAKDQNGKLRFNYWNFTK